MPRYHVTVYEQGTFEGQGTFVLDDLPFVGLRLAHGPKEWQIVEVRVNTRTTQSVAAKREYPYLVDVVAKKSGMFFTDGTSGD